MAGHSQFKNIMYRKGAQDAKRGKVFTKLIRELTVAARSGLPDPEANSRLRTAITAARAANRMAAVVIQHPGAIIPANAMPAPEALLNRDGTVESEIHSIE